MTPDNFAAAAVQITEQLLADFLELEPETAGQCIAHIELVADRYRPHTPLTHDEFDRLDIDPFPGSEGPE